MIQNLFGLQKGKLVTALPVMHTASTAARSAFFQAPNDCFVRFGAQSKDIGAQWFEKTKMAKASFQLGDYENAYRYYSTAKELSDPDNPEQVVKTLTRLGRTCTYLKRFAEGERYLNKAQASYPENPSPTITPQYELNDTLGELNLQWGQRSNDADRLLLAGGFLKSAYEEYVEKYPDPKQGITLHWETINNHLGLYHKISGNTDEAIGHIENALDTNMGMKNPTLTARAWYHRSLARLYYQQEQDNFFVDNFSHDDKIEHHLTEALKVGETLLKQSPKNKARVQSMYEDLADVAMLKGFNALAGKMAQKSQDLQAGE